MKIHLKKGLDSKKICLFFGGFGLKSSAYENIFSKRDIYFISDYREIEINKITQIIHGKDALIAGYSLGVAIASRIILPSYDLAINGTREGIDKELGINPRIYKRTMENFNRRDFAKQIGAKESLLAEHDLRDELFNIYNFLESSDIFGTWKRVFCSSKDVIFNQNAMRASHTNTINLTQIDAMHYPFHEGFKLDEQN